MSCMASLFCVQHICAYRDCSALVGSACLWSRTIVIEIGLSLAWFDR
jgi:hypothetical protein